MMHELVPGSLFPDHELPDVAGNSPKRSARLAKENRR